MFWTGRAYGFPGTYLVLSKTTESMEEANKVYRLSSRQLISQGWQPRFTSTIDSPLSHSPLVNLVVNLLFCSVVSLAVIKIFFSS